jgi:hypothetical protein
VAALARIVRRTGVGRRGHELYNRSLDELVRVEALGFDGVCVNEHHANAYGNMPSPNLIASILARQTRRVRIAVVGNERWRDLILNATLRVPGKLRPDRVPDPFAAAVLEFLTA